MVLPAMDLQGSFTHMNITRLLPWLTRPSRYLGTEINSRHRPWDEAAVRTALVFPDLYEIGMSHLGLQILYGILNDQEWCLADRAYCPDSNLERLMREHKIPAWGIESRRPLGDFDIVAFTLPYELCYVNILTILDLAGIPLTASERKQSSTPLILGGGSCALNPEPVADFFDAILCGDGEEAIIEINACVKDWKENGSRSKRELLEALSQIQGVYIPSFFRTEHTETGFVFAVPEHPKAATVRRRIAPRLHEHPGVHRPIVPFTQIVHDRLGIEIARGCTRGCRFCQAGIIYRPVRERPPVQVLETAARELEATGWDELSLLSLSTGDYTCLNSLIHELMKKQREQHVSISLPSLRVGTLTPEIMEEIRSVRKTGFTLAPEAGSDRLRRVINKGITEDDLLETAALAYSYGWSHMKLYFMTGLPTETMEDVEAIAALARRVWEQGKDAGRPGKRQVTVSIGTFVPKPHTPFQWEPQIDVDASKRRINAIRDMLKGKAFRVKWHEPAQSFLEGVFSRGDRRLSKIILRAWQKGARLDAWTDCMKPGLYIEAATEEGIDLSVYLGPRTLNQPLSWEHISSGVKTEYLLKEREKAWKEIYTTDCRRGKCHLCGVCDFKEIKPVTFKEPEAKGQDYTAALKTASKANETKKTSRPQSIPHKEQQDQAARFFCRITYCKIDDARFLGHLEMVHAFHRAARRAGIPVTYSKGFHPMPRVAFGQPLSLGMESLEEFAVLELDREITPDQVRTALNRSLPKGIRVTDASGSDHKFRIQEPESARYLILLPGIASEEIMDALARFQNSDTWPVERERKGKKRIIDAKKQVKSITIHDISNGNHCQEVQDIGIAETEWIKSRIDEASTAANTLLILQTRKVEGAGLKPQEIAASASGCCEGMKPTELFRVMNVLKI